MMSAMPHTMTRACAEIGCPTLTQGVRCGEHERKRPAQRRRRRAKQHRPSSNARGYDSAWKRIRLRVLREQPVCEYCGAAPATQVDHVVSMRRGGTNDRANLRAGCARCHAKKTNAVDKRTRRVRSV